MTIAARRFRAEDAAFCFRCRASAFIVAFRHELSPHVVAAGVNAYLPSDYVRMAETDRVFIVERDGRPVGFFTIRRLGPSTAEIPLIYFDLDHLGQGLGTWSIGFVRTWIRTQWPEVTTLVVDTVIPDYNGGFYRKCGFRRTCVTTCKLLGLQVPAVRFEMALGGLPQTEPRPGSP
jgi:GNAT superfamily N-acetyltransferase